MPTGVGTGGRTVSLVRPLRRNSRRRLKRRCIEECRTCAPDSRSAQARARDQQRAPVPVAEDQPTPCFVSCPAWRHQPECGLRAETGLLSTITAWLVKIAKID